MKTNKIIKTGLGVLIFFTLPSLLFFGYMYFKYHEDLPSPNPSPAADVAALNMLKTLNYEAYKNTSYIEWTFKKRHHYKWMKPEHYCEVYWKNIQVNLQLNTPERSKVLINNTPVQGPEAQELIQKAQNYFTNDSFWLIAPYTVFNTGTTRSLIPLDNNKQGLLVNYPETKASKGDTYLWMLDANHKPYAFKMWNNLLPIDGLEASWNDWTTSETGALFPSFHNILFFGFEITDLKTSESLPEITPN